MKPSFTFHWFLLILSLLGCIQLVTMAACPSGWVSNGDSCYLFKMDTSLAFHDAEHYCRTQGGHLVHINSAAENTFIEGYIRSRHGHYWIGLTDEAREGVWVWYGSYAPVSFTDWYPGEPNDVSHNEDCAEILYVQGSPVKWNDRACNTHQYFICELFIKATRLVNGNVSRSGFVELNLDGVWTQICPDGVGLSETTVICRSQGYYKYPLRHDAIQRVPSSHAHAPYRPEVIHCTGSEESLKLCSMHVYKHPCPTSDELYIDCAPKLSEIVQVSCTPIEWMVTIDMDKLRYRFPGSVATDIYMGDNSCHGNLVGNQLRFHYGTQSCLTSESSTNDDLVFTNELIYAYHDPANPYILRNYNWTLDITCLVLRNQSTHSAVNYNQSTSVYATISPTAGYQLNMQLYSDPNFLNVISDNLIHTAGATAIYIKAFIADVDWSIKMRLDSCHVTIIPSDYSYSYNIIKDGCVVNTNTHIISQSAHETRFVFAMFISTLDHGRFYLNCDAIYCDAADPTSLSSCQPHCGVAG